MKYCFRRYKFSSGLIAFVSIKPTRTAEYYWIFAAADIKLQLRMVVK